MNQLQRRYGQHRDAVPVDQEGRFVGTVTGAAVLDDAQSSRRDLVRDAMIDNDDAVGNILLEPLAGERVGASLSGDHGRDPAVLQPGKQTPELGAQHARIVQPRKERLDGVEHDAAGANAAQRMVQANEESFVHRCRCRARSEVIGFWLISSVLG